MGSTLVLAWEVKGPLPPHTEAQLLPDPTSHLQPQQSPRLTSNPGPMFKLPRQHTPAKLQAREDRECRIESLKRTERSEAGLSCNRGENVPLARALPSAPVVCSWWFISSLLPDLLAHICRIPGQRLQPVTSNYHCIEGSFDPINGSFERALWLLNQVFFSHC